MASVLVLIAAPGSKAIGPPVLEMLGQLGGGEPHWLSAGEAAEVQPFPRMMEFLGGLKAHPIDSALVSTHHRRKRLLVADMDSTMIEQECIDELGAAAGLKDRIAAITAKAMRGELDFEAALKERVGLLAGLDAAIIDEILKTRITYMAGGRTLIATMRAHGAFSALVSGGFIQFAAAVHLGFDRAEANNLVVADGKLTGEVRPPILGAEAKVAALKRLTADRGLDPEDVLAVGDGANDIGMLMEAGLGVALHAKPHVQASSLIRINHGDLTALLYLQGYRREQFRD